MRLIWLAVPLLTLVFLSTFALVHASPLQQVDELGNASLYIFGVSTLSNGTTVGVPAVLSLRVTNGSGQVFLGSTPLTETDTQAQAVLSTLVACQLVNVNCNDYNFYFYITSSSAEVGGPSAGAAFTIAAMSVLTGKPLNPKIAMTGTANPDGSIGIVGDVAEKSEAAANQGIKVFLYPSDEPSIDNMTSSALAYDENLGMVAIPIDSVYQAYQYFTGYNITPALNYSIYTSQYNAVMNSTYQEFGAYQQSIYDSLPDKTSTNSTINYYITQAETLMQNESEFASKGNYYVAASEMVESASELVLAKTLEELSNSTNAPQFMQNLISAENASIENTYNQVTQDYLTNSSTLDLKLIAIDRLAEASSYINSSEGSLSSNLFSSAVNYSFAEVKRASAIFWLGSLKTGNSNFSESSYSNLSNYYLYRASSFMNYAELLGLNDSPQVNGMESSFDQAETYQDEGHYVASIFNSINTIATAEQLIEENSISVNNSVSAVENQISQSALRDINNAEKVGVTPFLGISYYQYGNSFQNTSIIYYLDFEALSMTYTEFEAGLANASSLPFTPVLQPVSVPAPVSDVWEIFGYALLGFALGVLVSWVLYEYRLFRLVRNNALVKRANIKERHRRNKR